MYSMNTKIIAETILKTTEEKLGCKFCEKYRDIQQQTIEFTCKRIERSWQELISKVRIIQTPPYTPISVTGCPIHNALNNQQPQKIIDDETKTLLAGNSWLNNNLTLCSKCPVRNMIRHEITNTEYSFQDNPYSPSITLEKILFVLGNYNVSQHFKWNKLFVNDFRVDGAMSLSFMTILPHSEQYRKKIIRKLSPQFHEVFGHDVPIIFSKPLCALPHDNEGISKELYNALSVLNAKLKTDNIEITAVDGSVIYINVPLNTHEFFEDEMGIRYWLSLYFSFALKEDVETVLERPYLPKLPKSCKLRKGICD